MSKGIRPESRFRLADDQEVVLRLTNGALEAIERRCDCGLNVLFRRLRDNDVRISHLAVVLEEAWAGKDPAAVTYDEAFEIVKPNLKAVALGVLELIAQAFGAPPKPGSGAAAPGEAPTPPAS